MKEKRKEKLKDNFIVTRERVDEEERDKTEKRRNKDEDKEQSIGYEEQKTKFYGSMSFQ